MNGAMPEFTRDEVRVLLAETLRRGGGFAELFCEDTLHTSLYVEDGEVQAVVSGSERGTSLRLERGGVQFMASSNDVSLPALMKQASLLAEAAAAEGAASPSAPVEPFAAYAPRGLSPVEISPASVSLEEKLARCREGEEGAREHDSRLVQVSARYLDSLQSVFTANSRGAWAGDRRARTTFFVQAVARDSAGGRLYTGMQSAGGTLGFELFRERPAREVGADAARIAVLQLEGVPAPAGEMTVVVGASAGGTLIHEACGHGLEGDLVMTGVSVYSGRVGQKVASELVTVVDDGAFANARGTEEVDDEGTPSQRVMLIENGVLRGFLHSLRTAERLGMPPTGNGRRQNFRETPIPRMRNTFVLPGRSHPQDVLASVKEGLYVAKMGGGQVDVTSGNFVFHISEGYLIRDGRLGRPVRGATLTGCGPDVLASVDMVGSDFGFGIGTCGKDGQWVPVSNAQPTLRIPKIVVGGQA
jgi:TldD protein